MIRFVDEGSDMGKTKPHSEDKTDPSQRNVRHRIGDAVRDVAPTLAGAFGGPLAGAATQALADALFGEGAEPAGRDLEAVILARTPETLLAIRKAEFEFRRGLLDVEAELRRIDATDRANARARQIALKDMTPAILGVSVIGGFFAVLMIMLTRTLPPQAETEFSIMLGSLATMTAAVVNYFFGSSADSREKTQIMAGRR
ncbi:MAG: hypothetical protein ACWA5T_00345 [Parvularcula sp.]